MNRINVYGSTLILYSTPCPKLMEPMAIGYKGFLYHMNEVKSWNLSLNVRGMSLEEGRMTLMKEGKVRSHPHKALTVQTPFRLVSVRVLPFSKVTIVLVP